MPIEAITEVESSEDVTDDRAASSEPMVPWKLTEFPAALKNWVELRAMQRKHERGERHASPSRFLADIVREAKERSEREDRER